MIEIPARKGEAERIRQANVLRDISTTLLARRSVLDNARNADRICKLQSEPVSARIKPWLNSDVR
jgi:hypothetical protein